MKSTNLKIPEILLLEPDIFEDERGFFYESFNQVKFEKVIGKKISFVQDNYSFSKKKGIIRGLHFQKPPFEQAKLVRVTKGKILDVAVDIRENSKTYGKYFSYVLSSESNKFKGGIIFL